MVITKGLLFDDSAKCLALCSVLGVCGVYIHPMRKVLLLSTFRPEESAPGHRVIRDGPDLFDP